jgi:hypothetical protein
MNNKSSWKLNLLEDSLVIVLLIGVGLVVAAVKLGPILMRWAKSS